MTKGEEFLKYVTQKVVEYFDQPREQRKRKRRSERSMRESWTTRWFGMIPMGISMLLSSRRARTKKAPSSSGRRRN